MLSSLLGKLKEASTWRGLIWILTAVGITLTDIQSEALISACVALVGAIDVFKKN